MSEIIIQQKRQLDKHVQDFWALKVLANKAFEYWYRCGHSNNVSGKKVWDLMGAYFPETFKNKDSFVDSVDKLK